MNATDKTEKQTSLKKGRWCKKDDELLARLVALEPSKPRWRTIADKFGSRSGKQCRERWENHLKFGIVKRRFTEDESRFIHSEVEKCRPEAPKWAAIAAKLNMVTPMVTPLMVRNHVNNSRRKSAANAIKQRKAKNNRAAANISVLLPKPQSPKPASITRMSISFILN